jgi:hypothetical protein
LRNLITTAKGLLSRVIASQLKLLLQKVEVYAANRSPKRVNEIMRRNQIRQENGNNWFVLEEATLLEILASLVVPSDDDTPGVNEMDVLGSSALKIIDTLVAGCARKQSLYTKGLIAFDELAQRIHKSKFHELSISMQIDY